ncbi:hypothetical protein F4775DRAFT_542424 [Biscogniauxia sp. FL1348]|nr:hypothetical protein F4775DRAFT_542424 [Biscogniauxia sp. FL1348]
MPPRKRPQAESESTSTRRRSQRVSSGGVGIRKSAYFEDNDDDEDQNPPPRKVARTTKKGAAAVAARKVTTKTRKDESSDDVLQATSASDGGDAASEDLDDDDEGYDDAEASDGEDSEDQEEDYDDEEEEYDAPPPPKKPGRPSATAKSPGGRGKANTDTAKAKGGKSAGKLKAKSKLDDEDDEDEDEDEDRITFIPLPQLRDTGGVEYADTRLHKNTLLFLRDLKANNQRSWLKMHDPEYRRSLKDWESFVETLTEQIIEADETIPELPLKDVIFRIYRDIRFTKDPTPYKAHYSAAWSRTGRKGPYACYYVHAEPGRCQVGGGLWHPDNESLARLRASIDERPHRIRRVLMDPAFRRTFLSDATEGGKTKKEKKTKGKSKRKGKDAGAEDEEDDERAVLEAFAQANAEGALKTKPKGFHPEHRDIELLKLRNFTISKHIPDEVLLGDDAQERIMDIIRPMVPFITFLNRTARPDPDEESDSEVDEDGEDDDET